MAGLRGDRNSKGRRDVNPGRKRKGVSGDWEKGGRGWRADVGVAARPLSPPLLPSLPHPPGGMGQGRPVFRVAEERRGVVALTLLRKGPLGREKYRPVTWETQRNAPIRARALADLITRVATKQRLCSYWTKGALVHDVRSGTTDFYSWLLTASRERVRSQPELVSRSREWGSKGGRGRGGRGGR